jgi:hypothetical protein
VAHTNLHLAEGLAIGSALTVVPLARAWLLGSPLARHLTRAVIVSSALAIWAVVPIIITSLGGPPSVHTAAWANVFLGHAAIDRRFDGGLMVGELAIVAWFGAVYLIAVAGVVRARRAGTPTAVSREP